MPFDATCHRSRLVVNWTVVSIEVRGEIEETGTDSSQAGATNILRYRVFFILPGELPVVAVGCRDDGLLA